MDTRNAFAVGRAFCSTANLGSGFDTFGLALDKYSDSVNVRFTKGKKIRILVRGPEAHDLPTEASRNSAGPPTRELLKRARLKRGLQVTIIKNVPQGLGLGSSGATAAACVKAVDHLLNLRLPKNELVRVASLGEKAVAGTDHADNVAASLLGGFVVVYDKPVRTIEIKPPSRLSVVVVIPKLGMQRDKTRKARKLVPKRIEIQKAVLNIGRASAITAGFAKGDIELIGSGMKDEIAEPYRRDQIPGYDDVKRLALEAGAAGVSISGAGPSILALVDLERQAPLKIAHAMIKGFSRNNLQSQWFLARPAEGAKVIKSG